MWIIVEFIWIQQIPEYNKKKYLALLYSFAINKKQFLIIFFLSKYLSK